MRYMDQPLSLINTTFKTWWSIISSWKLTLRKTGLAAVSSPPTTKTPAACRKNRMEAMKTRRIMCPSVTKENKGENQRIINQSFHDVTRCVSFYVSKKRKNNEWEKEIKFRKKWGKRKPAEKAKRERARGRKKRKVSFCTGLTDSYAGSEVQVDEQDIRDQGWVRGNPKKESIKKMATMFAQSRALGNGFGLIYILRSRWLAECGRDGPP